MTKKATAKAAREESAAADLGPAAEGHETPNVDAEEVAQATEEGRVEGGELPAVYDSEARQRIPITVIWDERFDLTLTAEPVRDETLRAYAQKCELAAAETPDAEDVGAAQLAAAATATAWLFDALMSDVEGIGEEGEEKPADWRDIFSPEEKGEIMRRAVFGYEVLEPPAAKKGARPAWGSHLRAVVTRMRVPFNGRPVDVSHTLRKPDAAQLGEFQTLSARTLLGRGLEMDANLEKFAAGYDRLHVSHEHYNGPVPMHHKAFAYIAHMTRQGAAVRKN
jgi:hypothetical protein